MPSVWPLQLGGGPGFGTGLTHIPRRRIVTYAVICYEASPALP
ncbi:hypothetical protein ACFYO0_40395 [Streptomyces sp. NPDC006365]